MRSVIAITLTSLLACGQAKADYVTSLFSVPGASSTSIWDISDSGQFVGGASDAVSAWSFIYDAGAVTRIDTPAGVSSTAISISNNGIVVGSWFDASFSSHSYVYDMASATLSELALARATSVEARGISPDGRYVTGYYNSLSGTAGFVWDRTTSSLVAKLSPTGGTIIAQGINSFGQVVGSERIGDVSKSFIYDINTGVRTDFSFNGVARLSARAINDQGQIAGWLIDTAGNERAWIGNTSGYQLVGPTANVYAVGEGINNSGQVVGFVSDITAGARNQGFIASPVVLPTAPSGPGPAAHVYTFSTAVVADVPIFIDPLVAVGYAYKTGAGDPSFKSVSLPVGFGDNQYEIVVGSEHFLVAGNQVFDFTAHGHPDGVVEFSVLGIEPQAQIDPNDPTAFVTRITFTSSGMFTGTQTALTADYTPSVPEPSNWVLMALGLGALTTRTRFSGSAKG